MTKDQLKAKYPSFTVRSEPSPSCPVCKGEGERYVKVTDSSLPCLCVCTEGSEELRNLAADGLRTIARTLKEELSRGSKASTSATLLAQHATLLAKHGPGSQEAIEFREKHPEIRELAILAETLQRGLRSQVP